ncbi:MAG: AAA family ATPase, partial [Alphaproteobacteria bacterium]
KGMLRDGEGRDIDFKNTIVIMTSNAASDTIASHIADPATVAGESALLEALRPELLKVFKPAFLGRVTVVPYFPLNDTMLRQIVKLNLERVRRRVEENYKSQFTYAPELVEAIAARCQEAESGARNIEHILTRTMLPELARRFLALMAEGTAIAKVHVAVDGKGEFEYAIN